MILCIPCSSTLWNRGVSAPSSNSQNTRMEGATTGVGITTWGFPPFPPRNAGSRPVCPTANRLGSLAQQRGGKAVTLENTEKATGRQPGETGKIGGAVVGTQIYAGRTIPKPKG